MGDSCETDFCLGDTVGFGSSDFWFSISRLGNAVRVSQASLSLVLGCRNIILVMETDDRHGKPNMKEQLLGTGHAALPRT